jgi:hypothetical protein
MHARIYAVVHRHSTRRCAFAPSSICYAHAIDQALAWLIQSKRLHAFSIVPFVVVQCKIAAMSVMLSLDLIARGGPGGMNCTME